MNAYRAGYTRAYRRPVSLILTVTLLASLLVLIPTQAASAAVPSGFTDELVSSAVSNVMDIKFTPDGMALMAEQHGGIVMVNPTISPAQKWNLFDIPSNEIFYTGESGALSTALDPNWETNRYFYVYYTGDVGQREARIERFTMFATGNPNQPWDAAWSSRFPVWKTPNTTSAIYHAGGDIVFGNDDMLYLSTGDALVSSNSLNLNTTHGKVLRINPADGSAPSDNPFFGGDTADDHVWAYGVRNPFGMDYDPVYGRLLVADVGGNNQNTAVEEINDITKGANYGWNGDGNCEGSNNCPGGVTLPIIEYEHNGSGAAVIGGAVVQGGSFGSQPAGTYFYADFVRNWIKYATFDASGNVTAANVAFATGISNPRDLEWGNGALYYTPNGSSLRRIVSDNTLPIIDEASATPTSGPLPLTVNFTGAATDPNGDDMTFEWDFGDGNSSNQMSPSHQYTTAGEYEATLQVSDGSGSVFSDPILIQAGVPPIVSVTVDPDDDPFVAGQEINYTITATDPDGNDAAITYSLTVELGHNEHFHPGPVTNQPGATGSFLIGTDDHDFSDDVFFRLTATATDQDGLSSMATRRIDPDEVFITLQTSPPGLDLLFDSAPVDTPFTIDSMKGYVHQLEAPGVQCPDGVNPFTFSHWSDGLGRIHDISTPTVDTTYTATYVAGGSCPQVFEATVNASNNDAEDEDPALTSPDLDLGQKVVGVRFPNIPIPSNAVITSAYIQLSDDPNPSEPGSGLGSLGIHAVAQDNAGPFTSAADVGARPLTGATTTWDIPAWPVEGESGPAQRTPDLTPPIREVLDRPGWAPGNALAFIFEAGSIWRVAEAWDDNPAAAPMLHISYFVDGAPVLSLNGANPLDHPFGQPFVDPGAQSNDDVDPTETVFGTPVIDATTPIGQYTLTYTDTDTAGNVATPITRTVNVVAPPEGLVFKTINACAAFDSRISEGGPGPLAAGETRTYDILAGTAGCTDPVPASARAVFLNTVAVDSLGFGELEVAPSGSPAGGSVVHFQGLTPNMNNSNAVPVSLANGSVDVTAVGTGTDARGVVLGYWIPAGDDSTGLVRSALNACAVFDTRIAEGGTGPLGADDVRTFDVMAAGCGIPASAEALLLNLVAVNPSGGGNLKIAAQGTTPEGGVVNYQSFTPNLNNSNMIVVPLNHGGTGGQIDVYTNGSGSEVRGVVFGYLSPVSSTPDGMLFYPTDSCQAFDSRSGAGPIPGNTSRPYDITGSGCNIPSDADAVFLSLEALAPQGGGNLKVAAQGVAPLGGAVNYQSFASPLYNSNAVVVDLNHGGTGGQIDVWTNGAASDVGGVTLGYFRSPS